jgi:hypothetical protein
VESNIDPNNANSSNDDWMTPIEIYHVHRNILALGSRRSAYFATLFHYQIDDGHHCTNIELNARAASFFPDLLDYLYASEAFAISTTNAVALLFLSQTFQMAALQNQVEQFIESDINMTNFGIYLSDALYFSDERMAMKVMDRWSGNEVLLQLYGNNQNLMRIFTAPIDSTTNKAMQKIQATWTFLTSASKILNVHGIANLKTRTTLFGRTRQQR